MDQGQVSFLGYLRPLWTAAWSRTDQRQEPREGQNGLTQALELGGAQGWLTRKANQAWRGGPVGISICLFALGAGVGVGGAAMG